MSIPEEPLFTGEDIARAERREGFSHRVIDVIDANSSKITQLIRETLGITDYEALQGSIRSSYGFLADDFGEAGSYSLEPLELVAIWSRVSEIFPLSPKFPMVYYRYPLAQIISSAHIIQGAENPGWKKLPRLYLEAGSLPAEVMEDSAGLTYVRNRVVALKNNIARIRSQFLYTKGSFDENTVLLFQETGENFGNGLMTLEMNIDMRMQKIGQNSPIV